MLRAHFGLRGFITVEVIRHGKTIRKVGPFPNTIVDAGLDNLGTNKIDVMLSYFAIGTSNTAPTTADTQLAAEVARTNSNGGFGDGNGIGAGNAYWYVQRTRLFVEPGANRNITEIGAFKNNVGSPMFMRQLILDNGGLPTTITQTTVDQLKVMYEVRIYPLYPATSQNITISGTAYTVGHQTVYLQTITGMNFPSFGQSPYFYESNTMPALTSDFTGSNAGASTWSWAAYGGGNLYRDMTATLNAASGNFGTGVGGFRMSVCDAGSQMPIYLGATFTPKIAKTNTKVLTLVMRFSWSRH